MRSASSAWRSRSSSRFASPGAARRRSCRVEHGRAASTRSCVRAPSRPSIRCAILVIFVLTAARSALIPASWRRVEAISAARPCWSALSSSTCSFWSRDLLLELRPAWPCASASSSPRDDGRRRRAPRAGPRTSGQRAAGRRDDPPAGRPRRRDAAHRPSRAAIGWADRSVWRPITWRCHRASKLRGSSACPRGSGARLTATPAGSSPSRSGTTAGRHRLPGIIPRGV